MILLKNTTNYLTNLNKCYTFAIMNQKYKEPTKMMSFRCPLSKVKVMDALIKCKLFEYQMKRPKNVKRADK